MPHARPQDDSRPDDAARAVAAPTPEQAMEAVQLSIDELHEHLADLSDLPALASALRAAPAPNEQAARLAEQFEKLAEHPTAESLTPMVKELVELCNSARKR